MSRTPRETWSVRSRNWPRRPRKKFPDAPPACSTRLRRAFEASRALEIRAGADDERRDQDGEERRSRRVHYRDYEDLSRRSRGLYLDRENRKIVGVCAGVARYFGIEAWMARCVALTGLLFVPSVVFPAYWIAFIVMGHRPSGRAGTRRAGRERHGRRRARVRGRSSRRRRTDADRDHRSSAPASRARYSPRRESARGAGRLRRGRTPVAAHGSFRHVRSICARARIRGDRRKHSRRIAPGHRITPRMKRIERRNSSPRWISSYSSL